MCCETVSAAIGRADEIEPRHKHEYIEYIFFEMLFGVGGAELPEFRSKYDKDEKSEGFPGKPAEENDT